MSILWGKLPDGSKARFPYPPAMAEMGNWTSPPSPGGMLNMYRSYEEAFKSQAKCGTRLFLKKVDPVMRKDLIFQVAKSAVAPDTDVFIFFLSNLETDEQIEVLRNRTMLLNRFLRWPFTKYFFKVLEHVFNLLTDFEIFPIVGQILSKINNSHSEWYKQALSTLLKKLERNMKISVFESNMFAIRQVLVVKIIFDSFNEEEKEIFMDSYDLDEYFNYLIKNEKWTLCKCFIEHGFTEDKRLEFKMEFEKRFRLYFDADLLDEKIKEWNEVFQSKKINVDLGESSTSTKFQKIE